MTEAIHPADDNTASVAGGLKMAERIREHDWSATPLGPLRRWPLPLLTLLDVINGANQPMFVAWGPERTLLYNDAYADVLAGKHPAALGRPFLEVWHEIRGDLLPIVERAFRGEPVQMDDITLMMERRGHVEETHFAFSYTPVRNEAGAVAGFFCACQEITGQVLAERSVRRSEARLRGVLGGMGEAFSLLDRDFRILTFNEAALQLKARPLEEIIGRSHWEVYPGSEEGEVGHFLKRVLADQRSGSLEHLHTLDDGRTRWMEMRAHPVPEGLAVFWRDISERKAAEAEHASLAKRNVEILESISDAFYAVDRDWRFTYVNREAERWWGRRREELLGKVYWEEFPQALGSEPYKAHLHAAASREVVRLETVSPILNQWIDVSIYPTTDGGLSVYFRNVSEKKRAEIELRESEERFRLMADAAPQILWITDAEGRVEFFNKPWSEYTGAAYLPTTAAEVSASFVHPDDNQATMAAFEEARARAGTFIVEHRIRSKAGEHRWFLVRGEPYRDARTGEVTRWFGASVDIHDRKWAEEQLRELNGSLEELIAERTAERDRMWEASPDLLLVIDFDGVFRRVNPAWTTILSYRPDELVGHHVNEFVVPDDHGETVAAYELAARGGQPRIENRYRHKDGSLRWISWTAAPAGAVTYATGRDVTAERERQAELAAAQEQLRQSQKMEAMGQLTGGVAHDFNNLLTPIIASLDVLQRRGAGSERERRLVDGALQSAERAKTLVQRLLAFARRQPLQPGPVDVRRLVGDMAALIDSTLGPRVDVLVQLPGDLPPAVADANQLEMAILNLAVNARDAMPDGGVLTVTAARDSVHDERHPAKLRPGHYVRLSVTDTGTGMDEATLARAVEPFFSTKGVGRGTGLGLSMVHGLASQLGGGLTLDSQPGQGTTVRLWLPASGVAADGGAQDPGPLATPPTLGTALLVDDEELVRMSTADMLTELGYAVVEARSAEDALRLVDEGLVPNLVVTDHLMPGLSGADLARDLRARRPDLPVLIVSGYAELEGISPGLARLSKPFRAAELAASLAALGPVAAT